MKLLITSCLLTLCISVHTFAQTCNCNSEFIQVKNKIENNYAGFNDKVNSKNKGAYDQHTRLALDQSKLTANPAYCIYLINDWLTFFKDAHIQIGRNRISKESEKMALQKRIAAIEILKLSDAEISTLQRSKGITGIYWDEDSTSRIVVVKNKNSFRDYAGIVLSSKSAKWQPGQVILELKNGKDTLKGILYDKFYIPTTAALQIKKNALGTWQREGSKKAISEEVSKEPVASKLLSEKTIYMKISTFNQANARNIDSLFRANKTNLTRMPNLILDLRNNGGGADFAYKPIVPYLYTNPYQVIGADVLATTDNIKGWADLTTTEGLPANQISMINEVIKKMEQSKGKLVSFAEDKNYSLDSISQYPQKVIILINQNCGSSTEEFLFLAKQSTKITLMGERTAGVLDYANMRGAEFSGMPYMLMWATTRSRRIDMGLGIDNAGIKPDVVLTKNENWIETAKRYAEGDVK